MDHCESGDRIEADRLLGIAERLLEARDLVGSRRFAERAMDADPLVDGADQILAVADVLLAAQRRINNHVDWYAVLQLDPSSSGRDTSALRRQYRRLALLLRPGPGPARTRTAVSQAFKFINDAWAVLSDPAKKDLYDKELEIAAALLDSNGGGGHDPRQPAGKAASSSAREAPPASSASAFWTACPHCCHVFQYARGYEDRTLQCQICRKAFHAAELPTPPPIVPGTDMYYCSWGLFPLGFAGARDFAGAAPTAPFGAERGSGAGGGSSTPPSQFPVFPWWGTHPPPPFVNVVGGNGLSQAEIESDRYWRSATEKGKNNASEKMMKTPSISVRSPKMKKKVTARKPRKQAAQFKISQRAAGREFEVNAEVATETGDDAEMLSEGMQPENVSKKVGCSENAGAIGEGVDLNFTIEIDNTTDDMLENLSGIPFLKDGEIVIIN